MREPKEFVEKFKEELPKRVEKRKEEFDRVNQGNETINVESKEECKKLENGFKTLLLSQTSDTIMKSNN